MYSEAGDLEGVASHPPGERMSSGLPGGDDEQILDCEESV